MASIDRTGIRRVIVVVMDGMRADAVPLFHLRTLERLAAGGASTFHATTVRPSVTAAAMGSLFTGVTPREHGLDTDRFRLPQPRTALHPVPGVLARAGIPSFVFLSSIPRLYRPLAARLARIAGVTDATFTGMDAPQILDASMPLLTARDRGLFLFHWPDGDRAGHAAGWTSRAYAAALRRMDDTLGRLDAITGASTDEGTLLIAVADHGGGGHVATNHDSDHVHDLRIPLIVAGGQVRPGPLPDGTSLLDVPATVVHALGAEVPTGYGGRVLHDVLPEVAVPDEDRYALVAAC